MVLPYVIAALSGFVPSVIDTLVSSKTPEEAARLLAPMRANEIAKLVNEGMRFTDASKAVDESMQGEIQTKMQEGSLPPWANIALGVAASAAGGLGTVVAKGGTSAVKGLLHPFAKKVAITKPGTNLGKLDVRKPDVKLDRKVVRAGLPEARGIGAKNDGVIDEAEATLEGLKKPNLSLAQRPQPSLQFPESVAPEIEDLPPDLLPPFAAMASRMRGDDLTSVRNRLSRY